MGKTPALLDEVLLQMSIEEGEKCDEAYENWKEGFDPPSEESETGPESTEPLKVIPALPPAPSASSRIIGEKDRRRAARGRPSSKPDKQAWKEKGSGFR